MGKEGKISKALRKGENGSGEAVSNGQKSATAPAISAQDPSSASIQRIAPPKEVPHGSAVMVHDKWGEPAAEIRSVRSKILALKEMDPRVLTVSSGTRGEGKSTIAFNLAVAFREVTEGRVVIIDGDLRGPGVHLLANIQPGPGLCDILHDSLDLNGHVYETSVPRLDIVASGEVSDEREEEGLLAQHCTTLLKKLREHYEYVIIDTPPVLGSVEARTFSKHSDATLVVARLEKTPREVVKRAVEELKDSGAYVLGCILSHRKHHIPRIISGMLGHGYDARPSYYGYRGYKGYRRGQKKSEKVK